MKDSHKAWELWIKALTLSVAVFGGIAAYLQYIDTKEKEFYSTFWNQKSDFFIRTSRAASIMATTHSVDEFNAARAEYWELFFGPLSMVEGLCVKEAMKAYSTCIPKIPIESSDELPMAHLEQPTYRLTIRLKDELGKAWKDPFGELDISQAVPDRCNFPPECP